MLGETERARYRDLVDLVTIELVRHSVAEEAEVYPRVAEKVSDTEVDQAKHEHAEAEAEETMKRLDGMQSDDPQFDDLLATLMREVRAHVAEEEGDIFPGMRQAFTPDELLGMGAKVAGPVRGRRSPNGQTCC